MTKSIDGKKRRMPLLLTGNVVVHHHHYTADAQPAGSSPADKRTVRVAPQADPGLMPLYEDKLLALRATGVDHFPLPEGHPTTHNPNDDSVVPVVQWYLPRSAAEREDADNDSDIPDEGDWSLALGFADESVRAKSRDMLSSTGTFGEFPSISEDDCANYDDSWIEEWKSASVVHEDILATQERNWDRAFGGSGDLLVDTCAYDDDTWDSESAEETPVRVESEKAGKVRVKKKRRRKECKDKVKIASPYLCVSPKATDVPRSMPAINLGTNSNLLPPPIPSSDAPSLRRLGKKRIRQRPLQEEMSRTSSFLNKTFSPMRVTQSLPSLNSFLEDPARRTFTNLRTATDVSSSWRSDQKMVNSELKTFAKELPRVSRGHSRETNSVAATASSWRRRMTGDERDLEMMKDTVRENTMAMIRKEVTLRTGSTRAAYQVMDAAKTGKLSFTQFVDALARFGIDWLVITGHTPTTLFRKCDAHGTGMLLIRDILNTDAQGSPLRGPRKDLTWCKWRRYTSGLKKQESRLSLEPPRWDPTNRDQEYLQEGLRRTFEQEAYATWVSSPDGRLTSLNLAKKKQMRHTMDQFKTTMLMEQQDQADQVKRIGSILDDCFEQRNEVHNMMSILEGMLNVEPSSAFPRPTRKFSMGPKRTTAIVVPIIQSLCDFIVDGKKRAPRERRVRRRVAMKT